MADTLAQRFNTGKLRFDLRPPELDREIAKVFTKGGIKYPEELYGPENWKNSLNTDDHDKFVQGCRASHERHMNLYRCFGEIYDLEVVEGAETIKTLHLAHAIWNLQAEMWYLLRADKAHGGFLNEYNKDYFAKGYKNG